MKHINESIIGKRGSVSGGLKSILKTRRHPEDIFIIWPATAEYVGTIEDAINENNLKGIGEVELGGGDYVFVGTLKDFEKLHTPEKMDCDIYLFSISVTLWDAVDWIKNNIDWESDFLKHLDIVSAVFSGEIQF